MSTFIAKMQVQSDKSNNDKCEKENTKESAKREIFEEKKDALMFKLTELYHEKVRKAISQTADRGERVKYMNFTYEDFKANLHGIGKPSDVQSLWLSEMANPESKYLKITDGDDLECFEGLKWNIWGNSKFTTVFEW